MAYCGEGLAKGKITINDPTTTGPGGDFMIHLAVNIWDLERAT